jgi:hypothetical protein
LEEYQDDFFAKPELDAQGIAKEVRQLYTDTAITNTIKAV